MIPPFGTNHISAGAWKARVMLALLVVLAGASGCGSGQSQPAATATQKAETTRRSLRERDELSVRHLVTAYYRAFAARDWTGVCATLSPRARARFARKAGSCGRIYASTARPSAVKATRHMRAGPVTVHGDRATAAIEAFGGRVDTLYAARIHGRWWLIVKRAAKGAP